MLVCCWMHLTRFQKCFLIPSMYCTIITLPRCNAGVQLPRQERHHNIVTLDEVIQQVGPLIHIQQHWLRPLMGHGNLVSL